MVYGEDLLCPCVYTREFESPSVVLFIPAREVSAAGLPFADVADHPRRRGRPFCWPRTAYRRSRHCFEAVTACTLSRSCRTDEPVNGRWKAGAEHPRSRTAAIQLQGPLRPIIRTLLPRRPEMSSLNRLPGSIPSPRLLRALPRSSSCRMQLIIQRRQEMLSLIKPRGWSLKARVGSRGRARGGTV